MQKIDKNIIEESLIIKESLIKSILWPHDEKELIKTAKKLEKIKNNENIILFMRMFLHNSFVFNSFLKRDCWLFTALLKNINSKQLLRILISSIGPINYSPTRIIQLMKCYLKTKEGKISIYVKKFFFYVLYHQCNFRGLTIYNDSKSSLKIKDLLNIIRFKGIAKVHTSQNISVYDYFAHTNLLQKKSYKVKKQSWYALFKKECENYLKNIKINKKLPISIIDLLKHPKADLYLATPLIYKLLCVTKDTQDLGIHLGVNRYNGKTELNNSYIINNMITELSLFKTINPFLLHNYLKFLKSNFLTYSLSRDSNRIIVVDLDSIFPEFLWKSENKRKLKSIHTKLIFNLLQAMHSTNCDSYIILTSKNNCEEKLVKTYKCYMLENNFLSILSLDNIRKLIEINFRYSATCNNTQTLFIKKESITAVTCVSPLQLIQDYESWPLRVIKDRYTAIVFISKENYFHYFNFEDTPLEKHHHASFSIIHYDITNPIKSVKLISKSKLCDLNINGYTPYLNLFLDRHSQDFNLKKTLF